MAGMALLFTATLRPHGADGLAAVRFPSPIRVSRIRIFPNGAPLFKQAPHMLSLTHPDAFYLDLFFNALPVHPDARDRHRAPNALVPTSISYPGGLTDFAVDMGTEYATRLMIVKGPFDHLSLALYGDLVADHPPLRPYDPRSIPPPHPLPLSTDLDPSQSSDPTALAISLLALIPNAPSLPSAIRLMFCLKPDDDDWDNPHFPHIYANLDNDSEDYDLDAIVSNLHKPIPDDVSQYTLDRFVERLNDFVGPPSVDQAYQIATALSLSASQNPLFSQALLSALDLATIFDPTTISDLPTLTCLTDAASNALIARHLLRNTTLPDSIAEALANPRIPIDRALSTALIRLQTRIQSWKFFEDALTNPDANFPQAAKLVYEISREEQTLGNWLASMILHDDILHKLNDNLISPDPLLPPVLFGPDQDMEPDTQVSHDQFIAFVRACLGIASLLAVLAWADSVGNDDCRERALAVVHLWQSVEGYREIVNQLFLLRQLTRRLKWITTDNDPPRHSGLLAEKVLCSLTSTNPSSILNKEMVETILALEQPLAWISESERLSLRKLAMVVDDGLEAAVEELKFESGRPFSWRRVKTLRVSIAIVVRELEREMEEEGEEGAEWMILQAFWEEKVYGFVARLAELFADLASDLRLQFVPQQFDNTRPNPSLVEQLFLTSLDLLLLIERFTPLFKITARVLRGLVSSIVDTLICVDQTRVTFAARHRVQRGGGVVGVAKRMRKVCLRVLKMFCARGVVVEPERVGAEVVFKGLVRCGMQGSDGVESDMVAKIGQVLALVDHVLPSANESMHDEEEKEIEHWRTRVLPPSLLDLRGFMRSLILEDQVHLLQRLVKLDDGIVGVGEWLILEEAKEVRDVLRSLAQEAMDVNVKVENENEEVEEEIRQERERGLEMQKAGRVVQQHRVYMGLRFFWMIASLLSSTTTDTNSTSWFFTALSSTPELSSLLAEIFTLILEAHYTSPPFTSLTRLFAQPQNLACFPEDARLVIFLALVRLAQADVGSGMSADWVLETLEGVNIRGEGQVDALRLEVGRLCALCAERATVMSEQVAGMVLGVLEWLCQAERPEGEKKLSVLKGLTPEAFGVLCDSLMSLTSEKTTMIDKVKIMVTVDEDLDPVPIPKELPEALTLSLSNTSSLLERSRTHTRDHSGSWAHQHYNQHQHHVDQKNQSGENQNGIRPSTPKGTKTPDILGTIISPPTALLRSPAATGLTKTYANNDFRQLRQVPSARLNTSRLPSMHVDDFESGSVAGTAASGAGAPVSPLIVPAPIPMTDVSAFGGLLNMG